ncbi:methyltransferase domain-containing protein [Streptomyces sp. NPDC088106]|uniref:class I SAM-dependent methyltransferase n=1 Tax=Streptomyces sp. NPDC088106 TaxID=3154867 RepID=UPI0034305C60
MMVQRQSHPMQIEDWKERTPSENWFSEFRRLDLSIVGRRVLDIGCGMGYYGDLLAELGAEVYGLDRQQEFVSSASSKRYRGVIRANVTELPVADSSFDLVYARYLLHHIPRERLFDLIGKIYRALSGGGHLLIESTTPDLANRHHDIQIYPKLKSIIASMYPSIETFTDLLSRAGFRTIEITETTQTRAPYRNVSYALERSAVLASTGGGPTYWLQLNEAERKEFHEVRCNELIRMFGDGPVKRQWSGYFLVATKGDTA